MLLLYFLILHYLQKLHGHVQHASYYLSYIVLKNFVVISSKPSTTCLVLFSKTTNSCSVGPLQPSHALLLKTMQSHLSGPLQPYLSFPSGNAQKCTSVSHLVASTSVLHYAILPPNGHYEMFPNKEIFPPKVPHSSLSFCLCYLSEFSSLFITQNTTTMHHAKLGCFGFDVLPS